MNPNRDDPDIARRVRFVDEKERRQQTTPAAPKPSRRSTRNRKANPKYAATCYHYKSQLRHPTMPRHKRQQYLSGGVDNRKVTDGKLEQGRIHALDWNPATLLASVPDGPARSILHDAMLNVPNGEFHPMALQAKRSHDPDTPGWSEAMNGPHAEGYKEAAKIEYDTLVRMKVWDEVDREDFMNVLPSTWALKRKAYPDGRTKKFKGRICVRGDREKAHVHYDPDRIFAPVVSWTTVRLLLMLAAQLQLATTQVDYVAAFVHSPIPRPKGYERMSAQEQRKSMTYVEMPRGFSKPGKVLRLNKALYGLRSAPRAFFEHLKGNLEAIGFAQARDVDPCLFISEKVICLVYVDDTLLYAKNQEDIDEVISLLKNERQMELEKEDDAAGFLGVDIRRNPETGCVTLKQDGLKKKLIEALQIDDLPAVYTPSDCVLGKDLDGDPPNCDFNFASCVGMAWYLYGHSCPEIGFALSQLSRFTFNPKRSHELAMIRLGQYLKGTLGQALIIQPMKLDEFRLDVYVDSDFLGLYGHEKRDDVDNVRCRAGHTLFLNGCPIIWKSSLTAQVCTSTMMAEYYALSNAMKEVIPLRRLVERVAQALGINHMCKTTFKCTAHEDNAGAQTLANLEPGRATPRSKWYDVRVHWFRSMLDEHTTVIRCPTESQIADIYTKPLAREDFERLRKLLCGW